MQYVCTNLVTVCKEKLMTIRLRRVLEPQELGSNHLTIPIVRVISYLGELLMQVCIYTSGQGGL